MDAANFWTWYWLVASFAIGTCIGSFLNVCIYRLPLGQSLLWPASHCPHCKHRIAWYDNVPILSFMWLLGRCRHCRRRIALRYPLIELLTGCAWAAAYWRNIMAPLDAAPDVIRFLAHGVLFSGLIVASFIDIDHMIIPDSVTVPLMGVALAFTFWHSTVPLRPIATLVPPLEHWTPQQRGWFTLLLACLAAGWLQWCWFLWRHRHRKHFVGPADFVLLGAWGALVLFWIACRLQWGRAGSVGPMLERMGQWSGWWSWVVGLLAGAAVVWVFRLAGNGYLRLKRSLLAWRARQWRRAQRRRRKGAYRTDEIPTHSYLMKVILHGARPDRPWLACAPWLAREALGFGDVTLMAAVGAMLGWEAAVLAFFLAPFYAIGFSLARFILFGEREIPLGPFLALAATTVVLAWPWLWAAVVPRARALELLLRIVFAG